MILVQRISMKYAHILFHPSIKTMAPVVKWNSRVPTTCYSKPQL